MQSNNNYEKIPKKPKQEMAPKKSKPGKSWKRHDNKRMEQE